jgi:hypothetical protein
MELSRPVCDALHELWGQSRSVRSTLTELQYAQGRKSPLINPPELQAIDNIASRRIRRRRRTCESKAARAKSHSKNGHRIDRIFKVPFASKLHWSISQKGNPRNSICPSELRLISLELSLRSGTTPIRIAPRFLPNSRLIRRESIHVKLKSNKRYPPDEKCPSVMGTNSLGRKSFHMAGKMARNLGETPTQWKWELRWYFRCFRDLCRALQCLV